MKKLFFVSLILAVFTAVGFGQENVVIGKKVPLLNPPEKVVVSQITASSDGVRYEIEVDFKGNSSFVRFITDTEGVLKGIDAVIADNWAVCMKKQDDTWVNDYEQRINPEHMVNINIAVWVKLFTEKIAPTPVTVRKDYKSNFFRFEDSDNSLWEFVGINEVKGGKHVVLRKVKTTILRSIPLDKFMTQPQSDRPFMLAELNNCYYPVVLAEVGGKQTLVIDTQVEPSKKLTASP